MDCDYLDSILGGVDTTLWCPGLAFPISLEIADESAQAGNPVAARSLNQRIQIGKRPRISVAMARCNDDARVQSLNGFSKDQTWRYDERFASQCLQLLENVLGEPMLYQIRVRPHSKEALTRLILRARP